MQDNVTQAAENTDREIWREREGDYYADSIHVTQQGRIGINCGGHVIQMPVRDWHRLASTTAQSEAVQKLVDLQREWFCDGRDCTAYDHGRDEGLQMALDAVRALYPEGQP
ncbi:MAG: hypothetical protein CL555_05910 [Algoriphagus sp.]|nr:hypothetical protein [Algoriphagus sp.]QDP64438.1 MAG: hypothetical protein Tp156MES38741_29 [Prokaryotic dsDNA virus sp.]|tara:strand:+ start:1677 stop:2009 length:333 start_codon:yes stop_codon:yes gene_type:complete